MGFNMVPLVFVSYWNASWGDEDVTLEDVAKQQEAEREGQTPEQIEEARVASAQARKKTRLIRSAIAYVSVSRTLCYPHASAVCVCVRVLVPLL